MISLEKERFRDLIPILKGLDINTLFATSVLEGKADGSVIVDKPDSPSAIYIKHAYGMSFLYGEVGNESFYEELRPYLLNSNNSRTKMEWLQVYPPVLNKKMDVLFEKHLLKKNPEEAYNPPSPEEADKVLEYQRINFLFQPDKYAVFKETLVPNDLEIIKTSEDIFLHLEGSVSPRYFWNNYSDFSKHGIGFTLLSESKLPASTAFAAFVHDHKLEIGIETCTPYRAFGYATMVCVHLIDYCQAKGLEPVWSCNSSNIGSRKLAQKLGFEESKRIPYYILPISH